MAETEQIEVDDEPVAASPGIVTAFEEFFSEVLGRDIHELAGAFPEKRSLDVDYRRLEKYNSDLADGLLERPDTYFKSAEEALDNLRVPTSTGMLKAHVRVWNMPEERSVMVQHLGAEHLDKLISVEGIVSLATEIKPAIKRAHWECLHCGLKHFTYPEKSVLKTPTFCKCGRRDFRHLEGEDEFVNMQNAQMQDPVEKLRGNSPTTHIALWLEDDLVNRIAPGEKFVVAGILRKRAVTKDRKQTSVYEKLLEVRHLVRSEKEFEELEVTPEEEKQILELSKRPDVFDQIVKSIAPSIYGFSEMKLAVALQLFGGNMHKVLPDGKRVRGETHVLLIGDPGTAKSATLQYVSRLAPKCIYISGKGTSAVGLCVAPDSLVVFNDSGTEEIGKRIESKLESPLEDPAQPGAFYEEKALRIAALNGNLHSKIMESTRIWRIRSPETLVKVTTRRGKSVSLTQATPMLAMGENGPRWIEAAKLVAGAFLATSRQLPELNGKPIPVLSLLDNPHAYARVEKAALRAITDALCRQRGEELQKVAERYGLARERVYDWRHGTHETVPLQAAKKMALDAGIPLRAEGLTVRRGKEVRLPEFLDAGLFYLAGAMAADGDIFVSKNGKTAGLRLHAASRRVLCRVQASLEKMGVPSRIEEDPDAKRVARLRFGSVLLAELLGRMGVPAGEKSHRIDFPDFVSASPHSREFARGLFDCDGYAAAAKTGSPSVGLTTTSEKMARKMQLWLEQRGIQAKLRIRDKRGQKAFIGAKTVETKRVQYQLEIRGKRNLAQFKTAVGFANPQKASRLEKILSGLENEGNNLDHVPIPKALWDSVRRKYGLPYRKMWTQWPRASRRRVRELAGMLPKEAPEKAVFEAAASQDIYWDEVVSAESIPSPHEWVYDFTLPSHAFFANGIVVHNTASAEKDEFGEGWVLKAGALVLANGGQVNVDELDKMTDDDRSAMHEALESGTISIAKAGIVTRFNSRTSVLAAANPKLGRFNPNEPPASQFEIPPTLLSRFDLVFPIKDVLDEVQDSKIAEHILIGHRASTGSSEDTKNISPAIPIDLLRKYIAYARRNFSPSLTMEASTKIKEYYLRLRKMGMKQNYYPVTARQIEGLIRLAEASAKARLSNEVLSEDADRALMLTDYVLRTVFLDRETGRIDSDIINIGQPKSKTDRARTVLNIIEEKEKDVDMVAIEDVLKEAKEAGIDERQVREILEQLHKQAEIFRPRTGFVKTSRKHHE